MLRVREVHLDFLGTKSETEISSETSITIYYLTQHHIPEDINL